MRRLTLKAAPAAASFLLLVALVSPASADTVTFIGNSGDLAASVNFDLTGTTLTVTLTNTSIMDVLVPADVLTAVFFNTSHLLTPVSASLNGSSVFYGSFLNNVGEGWQYATGFSQYGLNSGISAAGFGVFGPKGNFFNPGVTIDGLDYGLLSVGDDPNSGNAGVKNHGPLIQNSVQFTFLTNGDFRLDELGTVVFQYGTSFDEPHFGATPEPGTLALLGSGLLGGFYSIVRKRGH